MYIMTVEKMIKIRNHYNTMNTFNLMVPLGILFGRGRMLIFVLSWMEGLWTKTEKKKKLFSRKAPSDKFCCGISTGHTDLFINM